MTESNNSSTGHDSSGTEYPDDFYEVEVETDDGKVVIVQEYPGAHMTIFTDRSDLYLTSSEASALRSALCKIDGKKRPVDTGAEQDGDPA